MRYRVVNRHKDKYDIYIGRGTKWGNPFKGMPRNEAVMKHRVWFINQVRCDIITIQELLELKGLRLGCSCSPLPCHGDIIAEIVNRLSGIKPITLGQFEC